MTHSVTYNYNDDTFPYASGSISDRAVNQFLQPAGRESYMQEVVIDRRNENNSATLIPIRDDNVDVNGNCCHSNTYCDSILDHGHGPSSSSSASNAVPRSSGNIISYGTDPNNVIENILSSSTQNSDRGSPASSDGQQVLSTNYELYNPQPSNFNHTTFTSTPPSYEPSPITTTTTTTTTNPNSEFAIGDTGTSNSPTGPDRPRQHLWIQRAPIIPARTLNGHVTDVYNDGVITFFCAWPGCTHLMGFAHKAQVITHVRSAHLQEKPYVCTTCNTTFARKQDAKRHVVSLNRELLDRVPDPSSRFRFRTKKGVLLPNYYYSKNPRSTGKP
ncbi:hypothetical protein Clacol_005919 [Clathrus columnatus]|uniref:C2H2-type domain-containing protein n=1 Tax=Clathrus columnatus TaxID=1419009 RepID=A0AAV5AG85_9AGAM|nr:hypothetical protein Clacol_005919 [Clathrus columnatus]